MNESSLYLHRLRLVKSVNDPISVGMEPPKELFSMRFNEINRKDIEFEAVCCCAGINNEFFTYAN